MTYNQRVIGNTFDRPTKTKWAKRNLLPIKKETGLWNVSIDSSRKMNITVVKTVTSISIKVTFRADFRTNIWDGCVGRHMCKAEKKTNKYTIRRQLYKETNL